MERAATPRIDAINGCRSAHGMGEAEKFGAKGAGLQPREGQGPFQENR